MQTHLASTLSDEGADSARPRDARQNARGETDEFPMSGNVGLSPSLKFAGISNSAAYEHGLVPVYDKNRNRIDSGKVAPFPWLPMPDSIVREPGQKKIFLAEEIRLWRDAITKRSRQVDGITTHHSTALIEREGN